MTEKNLIDLWSFSLGLDLENDDFCYYTPENIIHRIVVMMAEGLHFKPETFYNSNKCRKREFVVTRQLCIYCLRKIGLSFEAAGLHFGKDHSTAIYAVKSIENLIFTKNKEYSELIVKVKNKIFKK